MMHAKVDELLRDYNSKIVSEKTSDNQKFLIYTIQRHPMYAGSKLVGGLADRLKGLISTFYIAVITGRRFVVHWPNPVGLQENLLPSKYDWRYENARKFLTEINSLHHIDLIDRSDILDETNAHDIESELFGNARIVLVNNNSYRIKALRRMMEQQYSEEPSYGMLFSKGFRFLFQFVQKDDFEDSRERCRAARAEADKMAGVHLRTGSGNGWRDPVLDDWKNYSLVMERAFKEAKAAGAEAPVFYFFSDSVEAREAVAETTWPHKVIVDLEQPSHMDRSTEFDAYSYNLTFHEFQMLSEMDMIVCGKGGFASLAALAGGKPLIRYN